MSELTDAIQVAENRLTLRLKDQDATAASHQRVQIDLLRNQQLETTKRRVMNALSFPEMKDRRNMIESRVNDFGGTCRWIFSRPRNNLPNIGDLKIDHGHDSDGDLDDEASSTGDVDLPLFDDDEDRPGAEYLSNTACENLFALWLDRTNSGLYWISGKPGSGKSSLMNFIFHNLGPEIKKCPRLQSWAGNQQPRILSFWFFKASPTILLRTIQGFWRSICFQILDFDESLANTINQDADGSAPTSLRSCLALGGSSEGVWTNKELEDWCYYLISHSRLKYILLVDGLDEIEGDREHLVSGMETLSRQERLKLCCASRSEEPFNRMLGSYTSLHLHEVNYADILKSCTLLLQNTSAQHLIERLACDAEGVFLWADLVARELARASNEHATKAEIQALYNDMPEEMGGLFLHLLSKMGHQYRKRPRPYLRLLQCATASDVEMRLLWMSIASLGHKELPDWSTLEGVFDHDYLMLLNDNLEGFDTRLEVACAGLVHISRDTWWHGNVDEEQASWKDFAKIYPNLASTRTSAVRFIHRSVYDFLSENELAKAHLERANISDGEAATRLAQAIAASGFLSSKENHGEDWDPSYLARSLVDTIKAYSDIGHVASIQAMWRAFFKHLARCIESDERYAAYHFRTQWSVASMPLSEKLSCSWMSATGSVALTQWYVSEVSQELRASVVACLLVNHAEYMESLDSTAAPGRLFTYLCPSVDLVPHYSFEPINSVRFQRIVFRASFQHYLLSSFLESTAPRMAGSSILPNSRSYEETDLEPEAGFYGQCISLLPESSPPLCNSSAEIWLILTSASFRLNFVAWPGLVYQSSSQLRHFDDCFVIALRISTSCAAKTIIDRQLRFGMIMGWKLRKQREFLQVSHDILFQDHNELSVAALAAALRQAVEDAQQSSSAGLSPPCQPEVLQSEYFVDNYDSFPNYDYQSVYDYVAENLRSWLQPFVKELTPAEKAECEKAPLAASWIGDIDDYPRTGLPS
jgi:hypothetical protein